ncbi:MAG: DUF2625 family protein [Fibrobacteres bacterium]|nr:DUF2625 family protein [Fibrobacterota bacterium]
MELVQLQVTTRSPMGAIVYETGGILVDHGWLRILGSGHPRLDRGLFGWNQGRTIHKPGEPPSHLLIADDLLGGYFAVNAGGLGTKMGKVHYLSRGCPSPAKAGRSTLPYRGGKLAKLLWKAPSGVSMASRLQPVGKCSSGISRVGERSLDLASHRVRPSGWMIPTARRGELDSTRNPSLVRTRKRGSRGADRRAPICDNGSNSRAPMSVADPLGRAMPEKSSVTRSSSSPLSMATEPLSRRSCKVSSSPRSAWWGR